MGGNKRAVRHSRKRGNMGRWVCGFGGSGRAHRDGTPPSSRLHGQLSRDRDGLANKPTPQLVRLPCLNSLPLTLSPRRAPLGRAAFVRPRRGAKSPDVFRGAERPLEKKACCRSLARIRPAVESRGRARDLWPSATGKVGARAAGADLSPAPPPLPRPKLSSGSSVRAPPVSQPAGAASAASCADQSTEAC